MSITLVEFLALDSQALSWPRVKKKLEDLPRLLEAFGFDPFEL